MSLSPATKEVSMHPSARSVTAPTDPKEQQADVERKMRFYGILQAFRNGRLPTNPQVDETLAYVREHTFVDNKSLSPEGQRLGEDFREIIETARVIFQDKNSDELLQNFIFHTSDATLKPETADAPVGKDEVKSTVAMLLLTNSESRKLFSDATLIGRDLFAQGAANVAERARPAPDRMAVVDDAAASGNFDQNRPLDGDVKSAGKGFLSQLKDTHKDVVAPSQHAQAALHDPNVPTSSTNDNPLAAVKAEAPGATRRVEGAFDAANQRFEDAKTGNEGSVFATTQQARDTSAAAAPRADQAIDSARDQAPHATQLAEGYTARNVGEKDAKGATHKAKGAVDTAAEQADEMVSQSPVERKKTLKSRFQAMTGKVPQQHRERAVAEAQGVKNTLKEQFPKERRDQWIYRLKKVVVECQSHPSYKASLEWFLTTLEQYFGHAKNMARDQKGHTAGLFNDDPALQQATNELRTLLERFANNKSLDDVINAAQRLWEDAQNDEELRDWWHRVDRYIRRTLLEPGFILQPQCNNEGRALREESHKFFDERYKTHKDNMLDAIGAWFRAFGEDPLNKRFGDDWARLTKDLLFDENGGLTFKPHLWNDVRTVIIPELARHVAYIPIPRIEYSDKAFDLVIENLTLQGRNLFPNIFEVQGSTFFKMSPYGTIKDESHHTMSFTMSQIQADLRDCAFYYNKKTGFPKMQDTGLADVFLGGEGITVKFKISSAPNDSNHVFYVKDVTVRVDALKFAIKDSRHNLLYKTLKPMATGLIKRQISKAIGDGIRTGLEMIDTQLVQVRSRMSEVSSQDSGTRVDALKQIFKGTEDKTSQASEAASKVSSVKAKRESKFKIVPRRESMLLPEQGHQSGWSRLQYDKEDQAKQGDDWRSNAFSIIPGSKTHPAPTAPPAAAPATAAA
ncbi:hypothetical protein BKA62DRAFT_706845 [Auriculariales sp. MPI-PUGE-AT-0066]|nr:hypothetical protein BKA62DRAFT_706845 [Auriculariales sp. MPI-PUGE-AT-0066]